MRTLSLIAPRSKNEETNLRSDRDGKMTGPSLVETVLAKSYKMLETVDAHSFKAPDLAARTTEHSVALPDINDVIRRFNRDTKRLATLVVGAVVSVALILAVLVQDRHPKTVDPTEEAVQAGNDRLLNANSATLFKGGDSQGKKSGSEITTGQVRRVDHSFIESSSKENPSSQMEAAVSTSIPVLAFTPEINHINADANASSWSPAHWQDSGRIDPTKDP
jgi:hypothetical protein